MNNEAIGIGGVFAFTSFLFLLRYLYLSLRRGDKNRYAAPTTFPEAHELIEKKSEVRSQKPEVLRIHS